MRARESLRRCSVNWCRSSSTVCLTAWSTSLRVPASSRAIVRWLARLFGGPQSAAFAFSRPVTLVPHVTWSKAYLSLLVAVLGTTISPYLFFWQTANRVEEMRAEDAGGGNPVPLARRTTLGARGKTRSSRFDVFTGMALSNLVMFAIITATASTLGLRKSTDITSAAQAAGALRPIAGPLASTLFALGFIGSGMLAVPVLAGAGSAGLAGLLGRPWGLSLPPREAPLFYVLLGAGTVGGTALTVAPVNPISLLVPVAIVNGIAAAPFLIVVMIISRNRPLMGDNRNGSLAAILGWATVALMTAAAVAVLASLTGV